MVRTCFLGSKLEGNTYWMSCRDESVYALFAAEGEFGRCDQEVDPRFCRICVGFRDNG